MWACWWSGDEGARAGDEGARASADTDVTIVDHKAATGQQERPNPSLILKGSFYDIKKDISIIIQNLLLGCIHIIYIFCCLNNTVFTHNNLKFGVQVHAKEAGFNINDFIVDPTRVIPWSVSHIRYWPRDEGTGASAFDADRLIYEYMIYELFGFKTSQDMKGYWTIRSKYEFVPVKRQLRYLGMGETIYAWHFCSGVQWWCTLLVTAGCFDVVLPCTTEGARWQWAAEEPTRKL